MTENVVPVTATPSQSPEEVRPQVRDDGRANSKELVEIVESLVAAWDRPGRGQIELSQRGHKPNVGRLAVITTLASHVHRLADSVLLLTRAGHNIQAISLIRAAYETAITVQWVAQAGPWRGDASDEGSALAGDRCGHSEAGSRHRSGDHIRGAGE